mmetsp:Transcript_17615/g.53422  ORF Transcript_17615/g.53422 Transcript_17615/m.53422 type:complete len:231 (-) Transcript_17615:111-803(-)
MGANAGTMAPGEMGPASLSRTDSFYSAISGEAVEARLSSPAALSEAVEATEALVARLISAPASAGSLGPSSSRRSPSMPSECTQPLVDSLGSLHKAAQVAGMRAHVWRALLDGKVQVTAASAVGGAMVLGTGGAVTGLLTGGAAGAACGLAPALFTFGLSIPLGAAVGSGAGLCVGTVIGGTVGLVGGGAAGYCACSLRASNAPSHGPLSAERAQEEGLEFEPAGQPPVA